MLGGNYRPGCPEQQEALDKCRKFAREGLQNISRGRGLVLKGSVGTGKSHLSVAVMRAMIEASPERFGKPFSSLRVLEDVEYPGCRCSMIPVFDLLERLRKSNSNRRLSKSETAHRLAAATYYQRPGRGTI